MAGEVARDGLGEAVPGDARIGVFGGSAEGWLTTGNWSSASTRNVQRRGWRGGAPPPTTPGVPAPVSARRKSGGRPPERRSPFAPMAIWRRPNRESGAPRPAVSLRLSANSNRADRRGRDPEVRMVSNSKFA